MSNGRSESLMDEAESRRKETTPSTFTTKKVKTLPDGVIASRLEAESASPLKVDYGLAAQLHYRMSSRSKPRRKLSNGYGRN